VVLAAPSYCDDELQRTGGVSNTFCHESSVNGTLCAVHQCNLFAQPAHHVRQHPTSRTGCERMAILLFLPFCPISPGVLWFECPSHIPAHVPGSCLQKQPHPTRGTAAVVDHLRPSTIRRPPSTHRRLPPPQSVHRSAAVVVTFVTSFVSLGWFPLAAARVHSCSAPCVRPPVSQPALRWASFKR
jgi:hypothetical protein